MTDKIIAETIYAIRELRDQLDFNESGGWVESYYLGRHMCAPLPMPVNESILRLLVLAEKLELQLKENSNG